MKDFNDYKSPLELAEEFLNKRIDEKEYIHRRGNYKKWDESELLARDPIIFMRLLKQLRRVFRVNLMRVVNELDTSHIIMMFNEGRSKSNSAILKFFNVEPMEQESSPRRIAKLAIILDIPYLFALQDSCNFLDDQDNFIEYIISNPSVIYKEQIEKYITPVKYRIITGLGIVNRESLFPFQTEITYVRIDRRPSFFTIEFFIKQNLEITSDVLFDITNSLKLNAIKKAIVTTAFFRKGYKKLILVGTYKTKIPDALYSYVEKVNNRKQTLEFNLSLFIENRKN
jgi:hypothetical protein